MLSSPWICAPISPDRQFYRRPAIPCALITLLSLLAAAAPGIAQKTPPSVEIHFPIQHDVSPALRDIVPIPSKPGTKVRPYRRVTGPKSFHGADTFIQQSIGPRIAATIGLNFDGLGDGFTGPQGTFSLDGAPSDSNASVGKTQVVEFTNTSFAVFNKFTGATVYGPALGKTLWSGFGGPCQNDNDGDPVAIYDKAANRWVMTQFAVTTGGTVGPFYQCVAVSTTSDATGTYNRYAYSFVNFNDYPKIGVWPDGYYVTFNMFNPPGTAYVGARACALDRAKMLEGTAATMQCFQLSSSYFSLLPSDLDGATPPPAGSPNYIIADDLSFFQLDLWRFHVDWVTPGNSTFSASPVVIPTNSYAGACGSFTNVVCVPQLGTTTQLDTIGNQLMFRAGYRNFPGDHESIYVSETVGIPTAIRWLEIRNPGGVPVKYQESTFSPDSTYRFMPSIAADRKGNLLLGYSASSSSIHPGIRYTGRAAGDALNTMQSEDTILSGGGSQTNGLTRWGDYSSMSVDPIDDCTFWYTDQYIATDGSFNWHTRLASFKFPSCNTAPTADSVVPSSGSGANQIFTLKYSDADGYADLNVVYVLFNSGLNSVNACYAAYSRYDNLLYLINDAGNGLVPGSLTPGVAGTLSNSQCTVNGSTTTTSGAGNQLTLNLSLTFKPAFTGAKNTFMLATDLGGLSSGFQNNGTWTPNPNSPPSAVSSSPNSGSGASQAFVLTYSDPNGYQDLAVTYVLFNAGLDGANACFVAYNRPANLLYLINDAGTGTLRPSQFTSAKLLGPVTPGSGGSVSNSQCTLFGTGSSANGAGNVLTVTVNLTFLAAFSGQKTIFGLAVDSSGADSMWQTWGTWSRASNSPPATVSVMPNSGSGAAQHFDLVYSDADGFADLSVVYVLFNSTLNGANACFVAYNRPVNLLYLINDAGNGLSGSVAPGGMTSVSNSQCILSSGGLASGAGNNLTVPMFLQFKSPAFSGGKTVYMLATDTAGANSGWVMRGTWTAP